MRELIENDIVLLVVPKSSLMFEQIFRTSILFGRRRVDQQTELSAFIIFE